jgi:hypothetical protein
MRAGFVMRSGKTSRSCSSMKPVLSEIPIRRSL